jgi:thiamine pyrophosphokinase
VAHALILADGDVPSRGVLDARWPGWDAGIGLVVAADGGARHAPPLGLTLDRWVGDGDSLDATAQAALEAAGVPLERARPDKDETDTELAILAALRLGADGVVILGALGGRIDHALANIGLLSLPALAGRPAVILDAVSRLSQLVGPDSAGGPGVARLTGRPGDLVSLLPVGDTVVGVTTHDLQYPLRDEPLPAGTPRGLSNVIAGEGAWVSLRQGRLLVVETPATFPP